MTRMYAITATVTTRTADGWDSTRQVPTFYLHPTVQGILTAEHARQVACDVVSSSIGDGETYVTAVAVAVEV